MDAAFLYYRSSAHVRLGAIMIGAYNIQLAESYSIVLVAFLKHIGHAAHHHVYKKLTERFYSSQQSFLSVAAWQECMGPKY